MVFEVYLQSSTVVFTLVCLMSIIQASSAEGGLAFQESLHRVYGDKIKHRLLALVHKSF